AFAIEMDRPGIRPGKKENKLGMRVSDTAELVLEDCRVPSANILGEIGHGFIDAMRVLDGGRISIGALAVGIARGAYEAARDYSKQRQAFGKPISDFQAIQFMLADMATEIEAARLLCHRAATVKDAGEKVTQFSAMAKLYASEVAVRATEKGVQILGITGSPGAGKSTLVAALAKHYRKEDKRVGIIAVDPTSPFTGGAILGDRIRMAELYTDRNVFIRSMATRGFLGGLAKATNDAVDVLDAAGFDVVLVETVGVGQDEVEVVRTVQTNVVILVPGMGDDIQAIKAGIMEIGDVF